MAGKNAAALGILRNASRCGIRTRRTACRRISQRDISVLFPENKGTKDFRLEKNTEAPEGTAAGATTGAVIGGALAIPGIGPGLAAGPIVAALTGVGVGGAIGGITGAPGPEYKARRQEGLGGFPQNR
jgi:hypothetical protein